jgi:hypothetical protein
MNVKRNIEESMNNVQDVNIGHISSSVLRDSSSVHDVVSAVRVKQHRKVIKRLKKVRLNEYAKIIFPFFSNLLCSFCFVPWHICIIGS